MSVVHFYLTPGISVGNSSQKLSSLRQLSPLVSGLDTELCYNVEISKPLTQSERAVLLWLFASPFEPSKIQDTPHLYEKNPGSLLVEIGPRLNFSTPFSTNALSICKAIGLTSVVRLEVSIRYLVLLTVEGIKISKILEDQIVQLLHDQMTQCRYMKPINSFNHGIVPEKWFVVDVMKKGRKALEEVNDKLGLAFDDWDLNYYTKMFKEVLKRNPTSVECFDLAQSNSEHSRHWFFKGKMILDKVTQKESLIDMIINTQNFSNPNNVIKFSDNSSAIKGFCVEKLWPSINTAPGSFNKKASMSHLIFTAETHNFPTGVAPFSGATTGTGGRIRDVQGVGRGGHCIAGTAGYSVGNLLYPGYELPWEDKSFVYPSNFASPLHVIIEASNGASDYGNKFGEPVVCGYTRSYGMKDSSGERKEWVKPIMFSGGVGSMEANMVDKHKPVKGMKVVKVGGPVYRIGVGGGSASSIQVQGDNEAELDLNAVQRGDAEMENKLNRVIRGCIEDPQGNPICSIHDQGAGGNGNVLKELVEPAGAVIFCKNFTLGDNTISTMELWGAEYQENDAILVNAESTEKLMKLAQRERCPIDFVGTVTGNGKVILTENDANEKPFLDGTFKKDANYPFNLDLSLVLGKMPQKEFHLDTQKVNTVPLKLPKVSVKDALERVFRLVTVGSKRFLTNKVDRCVTGLIAQQQCVGPLHTPIADCAVVALSMFNNEGVATAIGEQPIKGLLDAAAGARMTVAESLTNLMFAKISCLEDVKCSGNWMWAAKLPGEGAALFKACKAMCTVMSQLGIAVDGGKDSLSMAARVEGDTVKAPGTLVVSTYAPCPDVRVVVTPDIKSPAVGAVGILLWVSMSEKLRLGGSALAQCFSQLGNDCPDLDEPEKLKNGFKITQQLISESKILAGHDISDGGLITCVLEMAFAGLSGLQIQLSSTSQPLPTLFSEEAGWVLEVKPQDVDYVTKMFSSSNIVCHFIGQAVGHGLQSMVTFRGSNGDVLLDSPLASLFQLWEETSYKLECRQASESCTAEEFNSLVQRKGPTYKVTFDPENPPIPRKLMHASPKVAVLREEGSNGDREMACSLYMAGFEVWDVVMQDFLNGSVSTEMFKGIIFPGGFSYADVLGSAKGWAACLLFNEKLRLQMSKFAERKDTFSLGVCNGCQLMGLLGFIGLKKDKLTKVPDIVLDHNLSERFECRFSTVKIEKSHAIMCDGMEGSILGVWVAHGEGRFTFREDSVVQKLNDMKCIPFKYVDDDGNPTEAYPMNPNGSVGGVAGICSPDGRHLALMPHPERCTVMWQWPYVSPNISEMKTSPWLRLFQNAFTWVQDQGK